jgi:hypothetical protein
MSTFMDWLGDSSFQRQTQTFTIPEFLHTFKNCLWVVSGALIFNRPVLLWFVEIKIENQSQFGKSNRCKINETF